LSFSGVCCPVRAAIMLSFLGLPNWDPLGTGQNSETIWKSQNSWCQLIQTDSYCLSLRI
jgi:hypothetical protein